MAAISSSESEQNNIDNMHSSSSVSISQSGRGQLPAASSYESGISRLSQPLVRMNILKSSDLSEYSLKESRAKNKIELMMDEG